VSSNLSQLPVHLTEMVLLPRQKGSDSGSFIVPVDR
jgi:hypothetical protein